MLIRFIIIRDKTGLSNHQILVYIELQWRASHSDKAVDKLQALVYDILLQTAAIIDYAKGLEKLSANG